nr:unnamed protein product [Spirometra erinaceieuropaei]
MFDWLMSPITVACSVSTFISDDGLLYDSSEGSGRVFAGIPCHFISGRSKGAGYRPGMTLSENSLFRNTWLAVYVANSWRFINCNWAARYRLCIGSLPDPDATYAGQQSLPLPPPPPPLRPTTSGHSNFQSLPPSPSSSGGASGGHAGYDEFYFLTEPSEHIYEHFPDKRAWQLLAKPISEKKFIGLPVLKSAFFNTKLALKKPYSARLFTKNGQVTVKLRMPKFVGISSSLENCADGSALRGLCLIEVLTQPADIVRVVCAPSQPGRYYLNVYVSSDWRRDDIRELACSFLVECSEFNFSRLVVMGRLPEVGFLGRTPAAQHFGVVACGATNGRSGGGAFSRPYILHTSMEPLKLPFAIASGLRCTMEFKINEDFAKRYNQYRQKEEYQKLKSRFGDVKVSKKSAKKKADDDDETDTDSDSSSSSSSSTSSGAEEWEQREHEDFLRLYDALCRGDPAVNDPNKTWFRPRPEEGDKEGGQDDAGAKKKSSEKPVLLKDHVRELLLSGEAADPGAEDGGDQKKWNGKKGEDPSIQKNAFLRETEALFEIADGEEAPLLQRKVSSRTNAEGSTKTSGEKSLPDTSHFTFAINGTGADQEFLRDYLVNRRWKSAEPAKGAKKQPRKTEDSPDALVDALRDATASVTRKDHSETTDLMAAEDLDADDEFLVKARQFEYRWNNNDSNLAAEYPRTTAVRSRFEEDDHEFIKSYPRNITSTLRQPTPGKLTRAEKRKAREERKRQKKAAKMAELQHLKRLKMAEFAEKLERIRKTCGDGVSLGPLNRFTNATAAEEEEDAAATAEEEEETVAEEVVDALENDWDPEEHDRLVQKLFGSEYYGATTGDDDLDEPPTFSDDDDDDDDDGDLNSGRYQPRRRHRDGAVQDLEPAGDEEEKEEMASSEGHSHASAIERAAKDLEGTLGPRSRGRKRAHVGSRLKAALDRRKPLYDPTKNPDFEKYFDEFYQLDCEDILTGSRPGEDIHCRFKYREVKPNDFGLTTEEILAADDKELNRYASVKLMSIYRSGAVADKASTSEKLGDYSVRELPSTQQQ